METSVIAVTVDSEILAMLKRMVIAVSQANLAPEQISDHANLFNDCGLDSTSIVELVISMEEEFGIRFSEDEIDLKLFQDLARLGSYIESKRTLV
jgi:acyl carrier protein